MKISIELEITGDQCLVSRVQLLFPATMQLSGKCDGGLFSQLRRTGHAVLR